MLDDPERGTDAERTVDFDSEETPLLPEQTRDDTERGWGYSGTDSNEDRLLEDRPPHWG